MDYYHNQIKSATMSTNNIENSISGIPIQGNSINHSFNKQNQQRGPHLTDTNDTLWDHDFSDLGKLFEQTQEEFTQPEGEKGTATDANTKNRTGSNETEGNHSGKTGLNLTVNPNIVANVNITQTTLGANTLNNTFDKRQETTVKLGQPFQIPYAKTPNTLTPLHDKNHVAVTHGGYTNTNKGFNPYGTLPTLTTPNSKNSLATSDKNNLSTLTINVDNVDNSLPIVTPYRINHTSPSSGSLFASQVYTYPSLALQKLKHSGKIYVSPYLDQSLKPYNDQLELTPELEPLRQLILLQHEVFKQPIVDLGDITLSFTKQIEKKKDNYKQLNTNRKFQEAYALNAS
jgi:hypothetical protein